MENERTITFDELARRAGELAQALERGAKLQPTAERAGAEHERALSMEMLALRARMLANRSARP
jgi:hypothetical protein